SIIRNRIFVAFTTKKLMDESVQKIGIVGSGSWATAMIKMLGDNVEKKEILWWVRKEEDLAYIQSYGHNPSYLSAVKVSVKPDNLFVDAKSVRSEERRVGKESKK